MKSAVVLVTSALLLSCTTQVPTPSPGPSATGAPAPTQTASPSPSPGATPLGGFPATVLGLPVHSVIEINQLAADGKLDGRLAAVGGYWAQFALPCPYMPHQPALIGFCSGGSFADTPDEARNQGGGVYGSVPITVPETANRNVLWSLGPGGDLGLSGAGAVVLIVHRVDSRAWQCAPQDRSTCNGRMVIDNVAWANGVVLESDQDPGPTLTLAQVIAAGVKPGEQLVTAYPLHATDLNEVDPRLIGPGSGVVWYLRLATGTPDADGVSAGLVRLVGDSTSAIMTELPLVVDPGYAPARLVLDTNGSVPDQFGQAHFQVTQGGSVIAKEVLGSSSTPFALEPGDYEMGAWGTSGAILATPRPPPPGCELQLTLAAGDDVAYYADWPGRGDCIWKEGAWPFN